jgi:hypothetical protein
VLYGVSCDACKTLLTFEVLLLTSVIIYFEEYSDTEYSLTYHADAGGDCWYCVTLMEQPGIEP